MAPLIRVRAFVVSRHAVAAALALAGAACDSPFDEPDTPDIVAAYLLDRVNGVAPPAAVCEQDAIDQRLHFESFALDDEGGYGRSQVIQLGNNTPVEQQERGDYEDADSAYLLMNADADTVVLRRLDDDGEYVRRIHPCGDTLRYQAANVEDSD